MQLRSIARPLSAAASVLVLGLLGAAGCSDETVPTAPGTPIPTIQIRSDWGTYGRLDPVDVLSAELVRGRALKVVVGYYGGCATHSFAAIGGTHFFSTYPATYDVFIRHDRAGDTCGEYLTETLEFNVNPVAQLSYSQGSMQPFYIRVLPPDLSTSRSVLVH